MAHDVYNALGCGYDELIYKEALMVELRDARISYERERYVPIPYGKYVIGTGKADIVVITTEGLSVPVECKKTDLKEDHRQQLRTYMKGMGDKCAHGILIRFPQPGTVGVLQFPPCHSARLIYLGGDGCLAMLIASLSGLAGVVTGAMGIILFVKWVW